MASSLQTLHTLPLYDATSHPFKSLLCHSFSCLIKSLVLSLASQSLPHPLLLFSFSFSSLLQPFRVALHSLNMSSLFSSQGLCPVVLQGSSHLSPLFQVLSKDLILQRQTLLHFSKHTTHSRLELFTQTVCK